jgi:hypothetical protein
VVASDVGDTGREGLSRVCYFAKVSLATRYRNLTSEDNPRDGKSCEHQASEISASFRRIGDAVRGVRAEDESSADGPLERLAEIEAMCEAMCHRVESDIRRADPRTSWIDTGKALIAEAYDVICRIEDTASSTLT